MLWGSGAEPDAAKARTGTGEVVAYSLALAAVLSAAGVVAQATAMSNLGFADRIVPAAMSSWYPAGLALAAALASRLTDAPVGRRGLRIVLDSALDLIAVTAVVASAYSLLALSTSRLVGADQYGELAPRLRLAFGAGAFATLLLAGSTLWCLRRPRHDRFAAAPVGDEAESELLGWPVVMPPAACLLAAVVALVTGAGTNLLPSSIGRFGSGSGGVQGFAGPGASFSTRLGSTSIVFNQVPIAFAAFTVVLLVAAAMQARGRRPAANWFSTAAAVVGLVAVAAAAHTVARDLGSTDHFRSFNWSSRVATIGTALASGAVGVATCFVVRRLRVGEAFDSSILRDRGRALRPALRVVAGGLTAAAVAAAGFSAILIFQGSTRLSVADRALQLSAFVLLTVGLAFAAVIVATLSRWASNERAPTDEALGAVAATVAAAALAHAVYVIYFILFGPTDRQFSIKKYTSTAQRAGFVAQAVAVGLIATGTLLFVWRTRANVPFDEPDYVDDGIPIIDLAP
jgi:hypothetical protein